MDTTSPGELVTIVGGGRPVEGIVFAGAARDRVIVAVVDHVRGPGFRAVTLAELEERTEPGAGDKALQQLIRRTPVPAGHAASSAAGVRNRGAAHNRAPAHRATGK
jgi:hypothetical protein